MALDATITAEDTFTDAFNLSQIRNHVFISLLGTWVANVRVQLSFDGGTTWKNVDAALTSNGVTIKSNWVTGLGLLCRVGVPTGDFTSGSIDLSVRY